MNNRQTEGATISARTAKEPTASSPKGNILIVDDSLVNLRLLTQMLTKRGYEVRPLTNGLQALEAARLMPPDLILLDIMMPEIDGYEVCERLKADAQTRDIPVIFISALDETQDKVKAFTVGGVDYIPKPFQVEEVLARVETHLALRNLQRSLQQEIIRRDELIAELDAYAHTVAHDLKNPLTILIGFSSLLEKHFAEMSAEELRHNLQTIGQNGRKMHNIIDELLLVASVREIKDIEMQPLDMAHWVAEAQKRLAHMIEEHEPVIILPATWPVALGYGPWVEEVWANYLSNAIKYGGRPPRIECGATVQLDDVICFWVRDNGPGLTPEEQARLFTPFERLHQVHAEGHGLGLSIVRRIVEKLGGQVGVESGVGRGSVFSFTLAA
jgi:two-component system sensor histidine kinase/response regulator